MAINSPAGEAALAQLQAIALALPEVSERSSHQTPTFFVREKKVIAQLWDGHHDDHRLAMWCPAPVGAQAELADREPGRFFVPAYVGHRGWIGVDLGVDPDWDEVAQIVREAYRLVAPKALVEQLDGLAQPDGLTA